MQPHSIAEMTNKHTWPIAERVEQTPAGETVPGAPSTCLTGHRSAVGPVPGRGTELTGAGPGWAGLGWVGQGIDWSRRSARP